MLHYGRAREIAESLDLPEQLLTIHEAVGDIQSGHDVSRAIDAFKQALDLASELLADPKRLRQLGDIARQVVLDQRGATIRSMAVIRDLLGWV